MKTVTVLNILLVVAYAEADDSLPRILAGVANRLSKHVHETIQEHSKHTQFMIPDVLINQVIAPADESSVMFIYHSRNTPDRGIALNTTTLDALSATDFTPSRHTIFLIHGWNNTLDSIFLTTVRKAVVDNLDVNVFVIDWVIIALRNYINSVMNTVGVGMFTANFMNALVQNHGLSLSDVTLVGHSLGAHVAGNAGSFLGGQIPIIVALDPAQPLVMFLNHNVRLDKTDAHFVQAIHSNGGFLGSLYSIGHADYYPNGGSIQPGCLDPACAHDRCFHYYAESLAGGRFLGRSCSSYVEYIKGLCNSNPTSPMGTYNIDTSASGNYYLETNSEAPFAKG